MFCQLNGDPLRPSTVTSAFEAHVAQCGVPAIRLHDARHGACSILLAGGVPIEVVQMILGHSTPTVTRRVYAHVMRKATSAQVERALALVSVHRREPRDGGSGAAAPIPQPPGPAGSSFRFPPAMTGEAFTVRTIQR